MATQILRLQPRQGIGEGALPFHFAKPVRLAVKPGCRHRKPRWW